MTETRSTCPYCGVGCGVVIESEGAHITGVRGDPDHPANFGRLCTKGSTLHLTATHGQRQTRLLQPMQRASGAAPHAVLGRGAGPGRRRFAGISARTGPSGGFYMRASC